MILPHTTIFPGNERIGKKSTTVSLPKFQRADKRLLAQLPRIVLTERDFQICKTLYAYRCCTAEQVQEILSLVQDTSGHPFVTIPKDGSHSRFYTRLQRLFHHGYIFRKELPRLLSQRDSPQFVYFLDSKGHEYLEAYTGVTLRWSPRENYVKLPFIAHQLMLNDVRIAFVKGALALGCTIPTWYDERVFNRSPLQVTIPMGKTNPREESVRLKADSFFTLETTPDLKGQYRAFLEVDRARETLESFDDTYPDISRKIKIYDALFTKTALDGEVKRLSPYEQRFGSPNTGRVFFVTLRQKHMEHMREITQKVAKRPGRFLFTTAEKIQNINILSEPIWVKANGHTSEAFLPNPLLSTS